MGTFSGFQKAKEVSQDVASQRAEKKFDYGFFRINSGQTKRIRFLADPQNEPYIFRQHYVSRLRRYFVCREDSSCVACGEKAKGDKGVSTNTLRAAFTIFDYSKYKKVLTGKDKAEYVDVEEDTPLGKKKDGSEVFQNGKRYWIISQTALDQVISLNDRMATKCMGCGVGRLKASSYQCESCHKTITAEANDKRIKCGYCKHVGTPLEMLECSKCREPMRANINACDFFVTKTGQDKSTAFTFDPSDIQAIDAEEIKDPTSLDLAKINRPTSVVEMARSFGVDAEQYLGQTSESYEDDEADVSDHSDSSTETSSMDFKKNSQVPLQVSEVPQKKASLGFGKVRSAPRHAEDPFD